MKGTTSKEACLAPRAAVVAARSGKGAERERLLAEFRAAPGVDAILALRRLLKYAGPSSA